MAMSDEHQAMAEYYYDIGAMESIELAEIGLMPQLALCTHGAAEFPTAKEVVKWTKETAKRRRRPHTYAGFEGPRGV